MEKMDRLDQNHSSTILRSNAGRKQNQKARGSANQGQVLAEFLIAFILLSSFLFYTAAISKIFEKQTKKHQFPSSKRGTYDR